MAYKEKNGNIEVYLQRRSATAKTLPNHFGFWGGGAEGYETAEQALVREIKEEMGIELNPEQVNLLNHYEFLKSTKDVFLFQPPDGWDESIIIGEGDYGKWFALDDAFAEKDIILEDKVVLNDLERILLKKSIK